MINNQESQKLWNLIKPLKVGMLVVENPQVLHARPMHLVQSEFDNSFYFFTNSHSNKVFEINQNPKVCLSFSHVDSQTYVSVSGEASLCKDQNLIDKFWNVFVSAWFPEGKNDPSVALIEIKAHSAEYWDADSNKIVQLFNYAKALISNKKPDMGDHESIN